MKKVEVRIQQDPDGGWWASSPESPGFFATGESRAEALENAKDGLSIFLGLEDNEFELEITETLASSNGE